MYVYLRKLSHDHLFCCFDEKKKLIRIPPSPPATPAHPIPPRPTPLLPSPPQPAPVCLAVPCTVLPLSLIFYKCFTIHLPVPGSCMTGELVAAQGSWGGLGGQTWSISREVWMDPSFGTSVREVLLLCSNVCVTVSSDCYRRCDAVPAPSTGVWHASPWLHISKYSQPKFDVFFDISHALYAGAPDVGWWQRNISQNTNMNASQSQFQTSVHCSVWHKHQLCHQLFRAPPHLLYKKMMVSKDWFDNNCFRDLPWFSYNSCYANFAKLVFHEPIPEYVEK